jgi:hypothetical protein
MANPREGSLQSFKYAWPLRALATAGVVVTALLGAAPVTAAELTLQDARHDMWVIEEGSTQPDPAPAARIGDVLRTTFRHEDHFVVITSSFLELRRTGQRFTVWVNMRDQKGTETTAGIRTSPHNRYGRALLFTSRGEDIPCNVRHRVNYKRDLVRIAIPRRCLDTPRWLKFQELIEYSGRTLRFARVDDPSTAGPPSVDWTSRVPRG